MSPHAFRRTLLAIAGTVVLLGVSFGLLAREAGLTVVQTVAMSIFVMAGSTQLAAVSALAAGAPLATAVAAGLALSLRYVPLGLVVGRHLSGHLLRRLALTHLLTDQGVALGHRPDGALDEDRYATAGLAVLGAWVMGSAIGAGGGQVLADPATFGVDAAYPALFLALLAPHFRRDPRARWAAGVGAAIAIAALPFLPAGTPILLATFGAAIALVVPGRRRPEIDVEETEPLP